MAADEGVEVGREAGQGAAQGEGVLIDALEREADVADALRDVLRRPRESAT
ncbi:MAG TPA: hypothetical protein VGD67_06245 [Pseudonocardiaceae bacterium]